MSEHFTWIPFYEELSLKLLPWENRQGELISFIETLRAEGLTVTRLSDKNAEGEPILMREMDPFTFFGTFNRGIKGEQRLAILAAIKQHFGLKTPLPSDFDGIPVLDNRKSWFVGYQYERQIDDVRRLWQVFKAAQAPNPLEDANFITAFDQAVQVRNTNVNLTMGLFWIRPKVFLALDGNTRTFLKVALPPKGLSASFYVKTVRQAYGKGKSLPELSYQAWVQSNQFKISVPASPQPAAQVELPAENNFWLVGAHWDDSDPADQTEWFLEEGIWQNGYNDRYLDVVNSMRVGDRIAIKATNTQRNNLPFDGRGKTISRMTIKAVGTIVANRKNGQTVEVEWEPRGPERIWYFYTARPTIWRLKREHPLASKLIDFVFDGVPQDYAWFCEHWWGKSGNRTELPEDAKELGLQRPYSVADMLSEGVFLEEPEVLQVLDRLHSKKNLILQGPPGVGKTFVARKLAYALMEECDDDRVEMVQFHQSYSYEDFVRGYRPLPDQAGTFGLHNGVFYEFCARADQDPDRPYVFIIDEINRGNLSQIFGELLMLIEADKRGAGFGVPLVYRHPDEPRFYVPKNVYLVGLMNVADRSLAMVDYALRRRFAFLSLEPRFDSPQYRNWLLNRTMSEDLVALIVSRMTALNQQISEDVLLGAQYQVGHSYFCPKGDNFAGLDRTWYESVVTTEIVPLLEEYWFDDRKRAKHHQAALLAP